MKRIAILQSNYVPWKGYFDLIASVQEFVIFDDAQYTKSDWRHRNKIKTPTGPEWLSVPVGQGINRRIRDVVIADDHWKRRHWMSLQSNYGRARYFDQLAQIIEPFYRITHHTHLSAVNRDLIAIVCGYLGITTRITSSCDYTLAGDRTERLANLCHQAGASEYVTGPAARAYLDESIFARYGVTVTWFDYAGYPEYPQLWGEFVHEVSILDLLFNCGSEAPLFMKYVSR